METKRLILFSLVSNAQEDLRKMVQILERQRIRDVEVESVKLRDIYTEDPDTAADVLCRSIWTEADESLLGCIVSEEFDRILSSARALDRAFTHAGRVFEWPIVFTETTNIDQLTFDLGGATDHCLVGMLPGICIAKNGIHPLARCKQEEDIFVSI